MKESTSDVFVLGVKTLNQSSPLNSKGTQWTGPWSAPTTRKPTMDHLPHKGVPLTEPCPPESTTAVSHLTRSLYTAGAEPGVQAPLRRGKLCQPREDGEQRCASTKGRSGPSATSTLPYMMRKTTFFLKRLSFICPPLFPPGSAHVA